MLVTVVSFHSQSGNYLIASHLVIGMFKNADTGNILFAEIWKIYRIVW
jgi:hypothetical protein